MLIKALIILVVAILLHSNTTAQGFAINTTGAQTNGSALLDVSSTQKGVLIPRMTMVQRDAIVSPATGLMVYQTDNNAGYWYFDGVIWRTFVSNNIISNNSIGFKAVRDIKAGHSLSSGQIIYDSVTFNDGNYYNNSNGRFTALQSGVYLFNILTYANAGSDRYEIMKNGSILEKIYQYANNTEGIKAAQVLIKLDINDYIQVNYVGGSVPCCGITEYINFSGVRLY